MVKMMINRQRTLLSHMNIPRSLFLDVIEQRRAIPSIVQIRITTTSWSIPAYIR